MGEASFGTYVPTAQVTTRTVSSAPHPPEHHAPTNPSIEERATARQLPDSLQNIDSAGPQTTSSPAQPPIHSPDVYPQYPLSAEQNDQIRLLQEYLSYMTLEMSREMDAECAKTEDPAEKQDIQITYQYKISTAEDLITDMISAVSSGRARTIEQARQIVLQGISDWESRNVSRYGDEAVQHAEIEFSISNGLLDDLQKSRTFQDRLSSYARIYGRYEGFRQECLSAEYGKNIEFPLSDYYAGAAAYFQQLMNCTDEKEEGILMGEFMQYAEQNSPKTLAEIREQEHFLENIRHPEEFVLDIRPSQQTISSASRIPREYAEAFSSRPNGRSGESLLPQLLTDFYVRLGQARTKSDRDSIYLEMARHYREQKQYDMAYTCLSNILSEEIGQLGASISEEKQDEMMSRIDTKLDELETVGTSPEELTSAITAEISDIIMPSIMESLGNMDLRDPVKAEAWEIFNDCFDPNGEWLNLADASVDTTKNLAWTVSKEVAYITASAIATSLLTGFIGAPASGTVALTRLGRLANYTKQAIREGLIFTSSNRILRMGIEGESPGDPMQFAKDVIANTLMLRAFRGAKAGAQALTHGCTPATRIAAENIAELGLMEIVGAGSGMAEVVLNGETLDTAAFLDLLGNSSIDTIAMFLGFKVGNGVVGLAGWGIKTLENNSDFQRAAQEQLSSLWSSIRQNPSGDLARIGDNAANFSTNLRLRLLNARCEILRRAFDDPNIKRNQEMRNRILNEYSDTAQTMYDITRGRASSDARQEIRIGLTLPNSPLMASAIFDGPKPNNSSSFIDRARSSLQSTDSKLSNELLTGCRKWNLYTMIANSINHGHQVKLTFTERGVFYESNRRSYLIPDTTDLSWMAAGIRGLQSIVISPGRGGNASIENLKQSLESFIITGDHASIRSLLITPEKYPPQNQMRMSANFLGDWLTNRENLGPSQLFHYTDSTGYDLISSSGMFKPSSYWDRAARICFTDLLMPPPVAVHTLFTPNPQAYSNRADFIFGFRLRDVFPLETIRQNEFWGRSNVRFGREVDITYSGPNPFYFQRLLPFLGN